jgi:hypothetical protein
MTVDVVRVQNFQSYQVRHRSSIGAVISLKSSADQTLLEAQACAFGGGKQRMPVFQIPVHGLLQQIAPLRLITGLLANRPPDDKAFVFPRCGSKTGVAGRHIKPTGTALLKAGETAPNRCTCLHGVDHTKHVYIKALPSSLQLLQMLTV